MKTKTFINEAKKRVRNRLVDPELAEIWCSILNDFACGIVAAVSEEIIGKNITDFDNDFNDAFYEEIEAQNRLRDVQREVSARIISQLMKAK